MRLRRLEELKTFKVEGFKVRGWQCPRCRDIEYSDGIDKVLSLKRLQGTPIEVKTREVWNTEILTIPRPGHSANEHPERPPAPDPAEIAEELRGRGG